MLTISATSEWHRSHPKATIGLLEVSGIDNAQLSPELDELKRATELHLRERYTGYFRPEFLSLPVMAAYHTYYKRFDKTYHVLLQLESIVLKGKVLPSLSPAVDANFIAEVDTLVLTAAHDVAKLAEPVTMDVSKEGDFITQMSGAQKPLPAGDMVMRDAKGVCCSILYGQDDRSPVSANTTRVLYVAYAPVGVPPDQVECSTEDDLREHPSILTDCQDRAAPADLRIRRCRSTTRTFRPWTGAHRSGDQSALPNVFRLEVLH